MCTVQSVRSSGHCVLGKVLLCRVAVCKHFLRERWGLRVGSGGGKGPMLTTQYFLTYSSSLIREGEGNLSEMEAE